MENQAEQGLPDAAEDESPQEMTNIQVRVLGCLVEKKETVPDLRCVNSNHSASYERPGVAGQPSMNTWPIKHWACTARVSPCSVQ